MSIFLLVTPNWYKPYTTYKFIQDVGNIQSIERFLDELL